jgi:3-hydroxyisobutyrate dehydrogenase-like beta-hydroxyacid dehydrogenase
MGQLTKAAHQVLVGATFAGMAEALVLGVKAGIKPEVLYEVIASGVAGSFLFKTCGRLIMERNFKAGSHIRTILKDLDITVKTGKDYHVPLFMTGIVHQMFQAAKNIAPEEDSWAVIRILEKMVGVEVKKSV